MEPRLSFSKDFILALDTVKNDINRALIYTIHVISSRVLDPSKKDQFCAELAGLGIELKNSILRLDVSRLTEYTLREAEAIFIKACEALHKDFTRLFDQVDRKFEVKMDPLAAFDIADIISNLKEGSNRMETLLTRDKIDNLLSIKSLIIDIYESQVRGTVAREKEKGEEKALYAIREKTFLQCLHNPDNRNPVHFFKLGLLIKKLLSEGTPSLLLEQGQDGRAGAILVTRDEQNSMAFSYSKEGLAFSFSLARWKESSKTWYRIIGKVGKPGSTLDFSILEFVMPGTESTFEKVSGIDVQRDIFERLLIQASKDGEDGGRKDDERRKKDIDDSLDDLLFGA